MMPGINFFWRFETGARTFAVVLLVKLIKKGRGIWPYEALATLVKQQFTQKVPTPAPRKRGRDKSVSVCIQRITLIISSSSDLPDELFLCPPAADSKKAHPVSPSSESFAIDIISFVCSLCAYGKT